MGRLCKYAIGSTVTLNCGVVVTITERVKGSRWATVTDEQGRSKTIRTNALTRRSVNWFGQKAGVDEATRVKIGTKFRLKCGVDVTVIERVGHGALVEDSAGNTKLVKHTFTLARGNVSWREFGHPTTRHGISYTAGSTFRLKCGINVTVKSYVNCREVLVEDEFGNSVTTTTERLRLGNVDWSGIVPELIFTADEFYVYVAKCQEDIVYVGKGTGTRYKHVKSGNSHSKYLNQLHFTGHTVEVSIFKDDLGEDEALALEKELILLHKPLGNTTYVRTLH